MASSPQTQALNGRVGRKVIRIRAQDGRRPRSKIDDAFAQQDRQKVKQHRLCAILDDLAHLRAPVLMQAFASFRIARGERNVESHVQSHDARVVLVQCVEECVEAFRTGGINAETERKATRRRLLRRSDANKHSAHDRGSRGRVWRRSVSGVRLVQLHRRTLRRPSV